MDHSAGSASNPRRTTTVVHEFSKRTLPHPSFLPLYRASGFAENFRDCHCQPVHPIIPAEFYYIDPATGRRIPNMVTDLRVFDYFRLNTPPPIMSTSVAPSPHLDPFRSSFHPTRILGSDAGLGLDPRPRRSVVQLSEEEDQAITTLLKLHYDEPVDYGNWDYGLRSQILQEGPWSNTEMEGVETSSSGFNQNKEPDHVPVEHDVDSTDMQSVDSCLAAGMVEVNLKHHGLGDVSLLEEREVSEVEKNAVFALLSLGRTES